MGVIEMEEYWNPSCYPFKNVLTCRFDVFLWILFLNPNLFLLLHFILIFYFFWLFQIMMPLIVLNLSGKWEKQTHKI